MLKIKEKNTTYIGGQVDFILEDGVMLFPQDWNGEFYDDRDGRIYRPILEEVPGFEDQFEIVGFED